MASTMTTNSCTMCSKSTYNSSYISCDLCRRLTHISCIRLDSSNSHISVYCCCLCIAECFPFNHILDDDEFINSLLHFFSDLPNFCGHQFTRMLNSLNAYRDQSVTLSEDSDPDIHLYKHLCTDARYFLPSELCETLTQPVFRGSLSILHINARSMPNKIDDIELLLQSIKFDFSAIAITETWETNTNSSLLKLAGYVKVSKARTKQPGGGVALF